MYPVDIGDTRVTSRCSSDIDWLIVNDLALKKYSNIKNRKFYFTDHNFIQFSYQSKKKFAKKIIKKEKLIVTKHNLLKCKNFLQQSNYLTKTFDNFIIDLNTFISSNFKIKKINVKINNNMSSTWLSTKYFDFAQKRDKAFTLYKQTNNLFHQVTFIKLRKICNIISKQDKTKYYETKVFQNQQNPKKMWSLLNNFRNIPNKEINNIEKIEVENLGIVTNKKDISNYFNDYFISIIEQLYGSINNNLSNNNFYLTNNINIEKF